MSWLLWWAVKLVRVPRALYRRWIDRVWAPAVVRGLGVESGRGVRLVGVPLVSRHRDATLRLGAGALIDSRPGSNVFHSLGPCTLAAPRPGARLEIGEGVGMSGARIVAYQLVTVGARTLIGAGAVIVDTDFHPLDPELRAAHPTRGAAVAPVAIGQDVFIGARAMVLKGVTIGDGAVIAAGAIVTGDVAAGTVVAGNPARIVSALGDGD